MSPELLEVTESRPGSPRVAFAGRVLLVALAYGLLGRLSLSTAAGAAVLWLPLGLTLAACFRWGSAGTVGMVLGAGLLLVDPAAPRPALLALAAGDLLAGMAGVQVLHRQGFDPRLDRRIDLALLVALCAGAALLAETAALVVGLGIGSPHLGTTPASLVCAWAGRAIGALLTALPALSSSREALRLAFGPGRARANTALLLALGTGTTALCVVEPTGWLAALIGGVVAVLLALVVVIGGIALAGLAALAVGLATGMAAASAPIGSAAGMAFAGPIPLFWLFALSLPAIVLLVRLLTRDVVGVERRWLNALGGAGLGVAEWQAGRDAGRASVQWKALTGEDSASMLRWLQRVHDDDRAGLHEALERLKRGELTRASLEVRVRHAPGWRWLDVQMLVADRDHQGHAARLIATVSDSSARHEAQVRQRLSASLFEHVHEGLLIADADLHTLDVNPAYLQILGVSREELVGTVPPMLRPAASDPLLRQQRLLMWSALRSTGRWRGEVVERRRDGQPCTLQVTISLVHGDEGRVRYHVLVISDVTEQRQQRDRLERQAHFDELTRLPNRARMMELLAQGMRSADQDGQLMAVCYLDLDRFKPVNDRFGHAAGDRLLVELAGRLRSALRSSEFWSDAAGRIGGDEFLLLLRASTVDEARLAVERVLRVVAQPYVVDPGLDAVQVTASIGATVYPIDRSDADTLLRHADHAMYGAKQAGRNGYRLFDPEHRRRTEERVMAIGRVQEALDNREFVLHYQPKVDMRSGSVIGLEALLRWDHPQQGLIAPGQFLPLIENTGLSSRIGDWVLGQALEHLAAWRRSGLDLSVSVNVSARHLQEPDFALRLAELLARHPEPLATALVLEVLETAAHADIQATSALLARCRALGVRFALDDFGTGYSTLTYLKQLPVDILKIDRSFVHHMLDDAQDRAIVEGVIGLARTFQCLVVAEGVESPAQARTLLEMGCHVGQGTGIAAPMPASAVAAWVRDYRGLFALSAAPVAAAPRASATGGD